MGLLRVIAVENIEAGNMENNVPAIACVYKNSLLHVYDNSGGLYRQKEFFDDFKSLEYMIDKDRYRWTDFYIEEGQIVYRDFVGNIVIDGNRIDDFSPLDEPEDSISRTSLRLYNEFLRTVNKGDSKLANQIKTSYETGDFKRNIVTAVSQNPIKHLSSNDRKIIIMSRIYGRSFVIDFVKRMISSDMDYKTDRITFFFTRLFKLEYQNYIWVE